MDFILEENAKKQVEVVKSKIDNAYEVIFWINLGYQAKTNADYYMYKVSNVKKVKSKYGQNPSREIITWSTTRIAEYTNQSRLWKKSSKKFLIKAASYETKPSDFIPDESVYLAAIEKYKLAIDELNAARYHKALSS